MISISEDVVAFIYYKRIERIFLDFSLKQHYLCILIVFKDIIYAFSASWNIYKIFSIVVILFHREHGHIFNLIKSSMLQIKIIPSFGLALSYYAFSGLLSLSSGISHKNSLESYES